MPYVIEASGNGSIIVVEDKVIAEHIRKAIVTGNRWALRNKVYITNVTANHIPDTVASVPLPDIRLWWRAHIEVGYAGWDAAPLSEAYAMRSYGGRQQVLKKEKDTKTVIVKAATALDAIAKAQYYLMKG